MSQSTFKELEAVVNDAINPAIRKQFERNYTIFDRFSAANNIPDPHPWTSDLRSLARMLNGDIELPHAKVGVQNKVCEICIMAFLQRTAYKLELIRQEKEQMAGILSKES